MRATTAVVQVGSTLSLLLLPACDYQHDMTVTDPPTPTLYRGERPVTTATQDEPPERQESGTPARPPTNNALEPVADDPADSLLCPLKCDLIRKPSPVITGVQRPTLSKLQELVAEAQAGKPRTVALEVSTSANVACFCPYFKVDIEDHNADHSGRTTARSPGDHLCRGDEELHRQYEGLRKAADRGV